MISKLCVVRRSLAGQHEPSEPITLTANLVRLEPTAHLFILSQHNILYAMSTDSKVATNIMQLSYAMTC